jgi:hypothetical protein
MRRPGGTAVAYRDGIVTAQNDTFNCAHCDTTVFLKAGVDPTSDGAIVHKQPHWQSDGMGVCLMCAGTDRGLLCPSCHKIQNERGGCRNFMRRLEAYEKRSRMVAGILGG